MPENAVTNITFLLNTYGNGTAVCVAAFSVFFETKYITRFGKGSKPVG